jgi:hypothetical protein
LTVSVRRQTVRVIATLAIALGVTWMSTPAGAVRSGSTTGSDGLPVFGPGKDYRPVIDPSNFSPNVDNPYFPLEPGTVFVSSGTKDGKTAIDIFAVSSATKVVDGVTTRVVEDRNFLNGALEETTRDYYAQDRGGNVWYFGEDTAALSKHGKVVDREGSFHAGVDGAQPGVYMQAHPELHRRFRQEWYPGHAEDQFRAVDLSAPVSTPYRSSKHALRTEETTATEPGVLDNKYYVRGLGQVAEVSVKGPVEKLKLVEVIHT